jgi:hypothetical protein
MLDLTGTPLDLTGMDCIDGRKWDGGQRRENMMGSNDFEHDREGGVLLYRYTILYIYMVCM